MRGFVVNNAVLRVRTDPEGIDLAQYAVIECRRRFVVLQNKSGDKFLIHVGYRDNQRSTIVCDNMGELITALALVRTAFPAKVKKT